MSRPAAALALSACLPLLAAPAQAAMPAPCPLTYPQFHAAVAHVDLPACPEALEGPTHFCRLVFGANGLAHVFVFTVEGAQCMVGVQAFQPAALRLALR